jgi:hypothetical protein
VSVADAWGSIWHDATTQVTSPAAAAWWSLAVVVVILVVPQLWHAARHVVTIAHEAGHALVATLLGRKVSGIRLHSDTSGLTTHVGSTKRLPLALVALAGYPAPALMGLGAAALLHAGYALALLWIIVVVLVIVLVQVRNVYGFMVTLVAAAGIGWLAWAAANAWRIGVAYGIAWLLLLGSVRAVVELHGSRRAAGGSGSDADALARSTRIPRGVWVAVFWLITVACSVAGGWLMVGGAFG